MVIDPAEEELVSAFRKLPAGAAEEVQSLVRRLASLPPGAKVDWSDEWSEEDLRDVTLASLRDFEDQEQR